MNLPFKQASRMGRLSTVLGQDVLNLLRFDGDEHLNGLFTYRIEALAVTDSIVFNDLIGTHATVTMQSFELPETQFDGIIAEAELLGVGENGWRYALVLRPWFWLLSMRRKQQIYHNKTVVEILHELFQPYAGLGQPAVEMRLTGDYPELEYTVQYRESDLAFATRLMERFGISYHFDHSIGSHCLVLTDAITAHEPLPGNTRKYLRVGEHHRADEEHFWDMRPAQRLTSGRVRLTDYNFKTPDVAMEADQDSLAPYAEGKLETYDYPGDYLDLDNGKDVARRRLTQLRGQDPRHRAAGDCATLRAGHLVTITGDKLPGVGKSLCLAAHHSYTSGGYGSGLDAESNYQGEYLLMPDTSPLAPERKTPLPLVHGPQTARVVGDGEIDCDEFGRILVRFHWDLDDRFSMRCRVSQTWAGKGWGGMVIPRIGMEVLVEFLEGDPDKPLVTGCVYNGKNEVPYPLPEHKTKSVFRSNTHQGTGFNELYIEDKKGEERIYWHAQKDHEVHIKNNSAKRVDVSEVESVGNSKYSEIGKDFNFQIGGNAITSVGVSDVQLNAPRPMQDYDDGPLQLASSITVKGKPDGTRGNYHLFVAQSRTERIGTESTSRIGGSHNLTVGTNSMTEVGGKKSERTGSDSMETVGGGRFMHVTEQIDLRCGASRFVMKQNGDIEISGKHIKLKAGRIDLN